MARVGVFSDTHFGYDFGGPRGEDPFVQAAEALDLLIGDKCGLVLHAGDLFDRPVPKPDVLGGAMRLFSRAVLARRKRPVKLIEVVGKDRDDVTEEIALAGVPIIAIHGTHERRPKGQLNPIQLMEKAGFVIALHCQSVLLDVGGVLVGVHGMGGVPERFARDVLRKWDPRSFDGAVNMLLLHQNLSPYLYTGDEPGLEGEDLPKGFDLVVNGHIHWEVQDELPRGGRLLCPGSTVLTQLRATERDIPKAAFAVEMTKKKGMGEVRRLPLATPRPFILETVKVKGAGPAQVVRAVHKALAKALKDVKGDRMPLVRVKLEGTLKDGITPRDVQLGETMEAFADRALVKVDKKLTGADMERSKAHRAVKRKAATLDELARDVLRTRAKEMGVKLDADAVFDRLLANDVEGIIALVEGEDA
ncbi:MAG: metallophosphoesterase [Candidatus Undinarchaeales archaeon]|jgi:DNA repair exonuclease SbcCD nuclease subunit|nr:metallophosphoesterase [Candidatus Undinarchaeales archaeon]MDP7494473.1 metallophosphoesterase [Candidatus Undinarchaeales archaeon]